MTAITLAQTTVHCRRGTLYQLYVHTTTLHLHLRVEIVKGTVWVTIVYLYTNITPLTNIISVKQAII